MNVYSLEAFMSIGVTMKASRFLNCNPLLSSRIGDLLGNKPSSVIHTQVATIKYYAPPVDYGPEEWPEERKLSVVPKTPIEGTEKPRTMRKLMSLTRGPEPVHNFLIYKQYGFQALTGGRMKHSNFEFFRIALLRKLDYNQAFAVWRIDPPWQAVSKKSGKKKMGGGKSPINHYVTPVKAGRIILELGGSIHPAMIKKHFALMAENLPFPARFVSQEMLEEEAKEEKWKEENNINPYTMKYVILNNMGGCNNWLSPRDYEWFGKYR